VNQWRIKAGGSLEAVGLQPSTKYGIKKPMFCREDVIKNFTCFTPSRNQPLKLASDWYVRILKTEKIKKVFVVVKEQEN